MTKHDRGVLCIGFAAILAVTAGPRAEAQTATDDEDSLFADAGISGIVEGGADPAGTPESTAEVRIGGSYRATLSSRWSYDGLAGPFGATLLSDALALDLGAVVFLDARPSDDLRVFTKADLSHPFTSAGGTREFDDVLRVKELFADFHLGDVVFFRAGKQTIHWGVGWFFSPADLLSVTTIDPLDPGAEQEGPVAVKVQAPFGPHNAYLYAVVEDAEHVDEIAVAPKVEVVLGDAELSLGAFYRQDSAPAIMLTATTSIGDFKLFGEGVLAYGSDRTYVVDDGSLPFGVSTVTYDDVFFPSITAGVRWSWADDRELFALTAVAQYLYNGQGYTDAGLLVREAAGVAALLGAGDLAPTDLVGTGRHYGAASAAWSDMLGSDFTLSCSWLGNVSDGSGVLAPSLRWKPVDQLGLYVKATVAYGDAGAEYSRTGEGTSVAVGLDLGNGSF
jgi:hypothetical protein